MSFKRSASQQKQPKMESQGNGSRLAKLQMRYQQKQKEEMEKKRNELIGPKSGAPALEMNENSRIQIGNGKVRQMFVERRQRVTGIDKSYPLQPISSKAAPNNTSRQIKATTTTAKRSVNPNHNGTYDNSLKFPTSRAGRESKNFSQATTITTNNRFGNRNALSSKLSDIDYIENEQIPDIFSQLDDIDTMDSGRRFTGIERQIANLNVADSNSYGSVGSANIKLGPVITRKTMAQNSATSLNTLKKLPAQPNRGRSVPISPEKASIPYKGNSLSSSSAKKATNGNVTPNSNASSMRSSASSNSSAKNVRPMSGPPPEGMTACDTCGRFFNTDRIDKHENICKKTSTKKRKIFDATKHRVKGTEAEVYVKKNAKMPARKQSDTPGKKSDWRRKHEEFIRAIRSAKQMQQHLANGGKLSDLPPPPVSENPDYVQCPHCKRRFNETAAERHIPKCANFQFNKPKSDAGGRAALARKRF